MSVLSSVATRGKCFVTLISASAVCMILMAMPDRAQIVAPEKKETKMTQSDTNPGAAMQPVNQTEIRPFHVNIPEEALTDLRRRIGATKWPERELVPDASQGVQLAT